MVKNPPANAGDAGVEGSSPVSGISPGVGNGNPLQFSCWENQWTKEMMTDYIAHQAPLSMGFSRQEYWSGLPFLSPEDLPDPGIEPMSPELAGGFFPPEPQVLYQINRMQC